MTRLERIFEETARLSPIEVAELLERLSFQAPADARADEVEVGRRGLASWTESATPEDWSTYYPDALKNGGRNHP